MIAVFEGSGREAEQLAGGEFVDAPVAERAKRTLKLAGALARRAG